jgi:triosephosphate isomerase
MRRKLIAGNWKMNKTDAEAVELAKALVAAVGQVGDRDVLLCPPFTSIKSVADAVKGSKIKVGGQTLHWEKDGAFTGMISGPMLVALGCSHVIIAHSEQRQFFGETDETANKRIKAALSYNLVPILCVGEMLADRESGKHESVVGSQLRGGLVGITPDQMKKIVIAYEPVWAIGTGKTATPKDANDMHAFIRGTIAKLYDASIAAGTVIQYGGSVKADNVDELMSCEHIDGALVGGAALKADSFGRIVQYK